MADSIKISGKKFKLDPQSASPDWKFSPRPGGWIIAESADGTRRRVILQENRNRWTWALRGYLWMGDWAQEQKSVSGPGGGDTDLVAQFPGKVRKVLVKEGASVQEGDILLLVEAMKMEFSIRAPFAGKVARVRVKDGQQLAPGDQFVDLEADTSGK